MAEQSVEETRNLRSDGTENKEKIIRSTADDTTDNFLKSLVLLANAGAQLSITLTLSGFLVSGTLVSGRRYFEQLIVSNLMKDVPESTRQGLTKFLDGFRELYQSRSDFSDENEYVTTFIHLKDARFFHNAGQPIPANRPVWWRGRLSEVQGFFIGDLGNDDVDEFTTYRF